MRIGTAMAAMALLLAACGGDSEIEAPASSSATTVGSEGAPIVGPSGGSVRSGDGELVLDLPAGALSAAEEISIEAVPASEYGLEPGVVLGTIYDLKPDGLTLSKPATLTRTIPAEELGQLSDVIPFLAVANEESAGWSFPPTTVAINGNGVMVTSEVGHFSGTAVVDVHE